MKQFLDPWLLLVYWLQLNCWPRLALHIENMHASVFANVVDCGHSELNEMLTLSVTNGSINALYPNFVSAEL